MSLTHQSQRGESHSVARTPSSTSNSGWRRLEPHVQISHSLDGPILDPSTYLDDIFLGSSRSYNQQQPQSRVRPQDEGFTSNMSTPFTSQPAAAVATTSPKHGCPICDKPYGRMSDLRTHAGIMSNDWKTFAGQTLDGHDAPKCTRDLRSACFIAPFSAKDALTLLDEVISFSMKFSSGDLPPTRVGIPTSQVVEGLRTVLQTQGMKARWRAVLPFISINASHVTWDQAGLIARLERIPCVTGVKFDDFAMCLAHLLDFAHQQVQI